MADENKLIYADTEPAEKKEEPATGTKRNKNSLFLYLAVLFAAALVLVLISFVMERRESSVRISALTQQAESGTARIEELEALKAQLEEDNADLATRAGELQTQTESLQDRIASLTEQTETLTDGMGNLNDAYDALSEENTDLSEAYAALQAEQETLTAQLAELRDLLDRTAADYAAVQEELSRDVEELTTLRAAGLANEQLLTAVNCWLVRDTGSMSAALSGLDTTALSETGLSVYERVQALLSSSEHAE